MYTGVFNKYGNDRFLYPISLLGILLSFELLSPIITDNLTAICLRGVPFGITTENGAPLISFVIFEDTEAVFPERQRIENKV